MAPPQKPETFMLSNEAQQSLPQDAQVALQQVDNLKYFLISAPVDWTPDQYIRRFLLPTGEYVSCVLWNNLFHISGTDIVRCLSFRFQAFGRPVKNSKKFEEGIFSDLRNLKSGTDASLEEPKSGFLDFLYKNNCIRTQKKQKVFYWYSVPHDRLFLDALERDLKREKMGQEATTMAVNEPALSFEFDSSQSLFEQLTKAQQANSSSFSANANPNYSQSTSPVMRAMDSMPPPQMIPNSVPQSAPEELNQVTNFSQMSSMPQNMNVAANNPNGAPKRMEPDFGQMQYDRNGIPLSRAHQRHASMPTYMEYSPAPSFVSSQYEDYSNRGISYEPITPPQQAIPLGAEPAYIANEDTGLYTAIPEVHSMGNMNGLMQLPPSNLTGAQFTPNPRGFGGNGVYSVIEGSPTYKQRRRRSSIPPGMAAAVAAATAAGGAGAHTAHRPSDLRRSVSSSVVPLTEGDESVNDSPPGLTNGYAMPMSQHKDLLELSRHGTPLPTLEGSPAPHSMGPMPSHDEYGVLSNGDLSQDGGMHAMSDKRPGPARRARSATVMELGPYPQKSHSCPIPTCGRLFKRLEHLKRHVRTHTQERPYICPHCNKAFSRSDNLAQHRRTHEKMEGGGEAYGSFSEEDLEGEDEQLGSLEEASPNSEQGYLTGSIGDMTAMTAPLGMPGSAMNTPNQLMNTQQMLQQPM
ncbi:MAG: homeodomain transcription factor ste12 [Thelocarpon superellum]|nr:MAG: homeodomain transcription factor ste12 [Thelocarpon superellum]